MRPYMHYTFDELINALRVYSNGEYVGKVILLLEELSRRHTELELQDLQEA